jgi:hypothetical protein
MVDKWHHADTQIDLVLEAVVSEIEGIRLKKTKYGTTVPLQVFTLKYYGHTREVSIWGKEIERWADVEKDDRVRLERVQLKYINEYVDLVVVWRSSSSLTVLDRPAESLTAEQQERLVALIEASKRVPAAEKQASCMFWHNEDCGMYLHIPEGACEACRDYRDGRNEPEMKKWAVSTLMRSFRRKFPAEELKDRQAR